MNTESESRHDAHDSQDQENPVHLVNPVSSPSEPNEKSIARQNDLARAAQLLVVDVRDSADWAHHYLTGQNHDAFRAAYARLHEKLKEAHALLAEHIDNLETV